MYLFLGRLSPAKVGQVLSACVLYPQEVERPTGILLMIRSESQWQHLELSHLEIEDKQLYKGIISN